MAIRLGARDGFRREAAERAGVVLDHDVAAHQRAHFLGVEAHDDVRAGTRSEATDEMHVLQGIGLRTPDPHSSQRAERDGR